MINIKAASGTDLSHPTPKPNIKKGPKLALQIENKLAFLGVGVKRLLMALVVMGSVIEGLQCASDNGDLLRGWALIMDAMKSVKGLLF
jgi:hypothetical protein